MNRFSKLGIFLLLVSIGYFIYTKKSHHYLRGDSLLLVDFLNEEYIQFPGLNARNKSSSIFPLSGSWKLVETRRSKSSIWTIQAPVVASPGSRSHLLYKGKLVHQGDVLQRDTVFPLWDIRNNQIWLAHGTIEPPAPNDYVLQQKVGMTKEVPETFTRKLISNDLVCFTDSGRGQRNVFFLSLPEAAKTGDDMTSLKVTGSTTSPIYKSGILRSIYQTERITQLFSDDKNPLTLNNQKTWEKSLNIPSGRWILNFSAKSSFASEAPTLEVSLNKQKVSIFTVENQDWKHFYIEIRTEQNKNGLELRVSGKLDSTFKNLIFLKEVSIWPAHQTEGTGDESGIQWEQIHFGKTQIYQPPEETVLNFSNTRPVWTKSRYFLPGPISIIVTARTHEPETVSLQLGVYLGKRRLGKVVVQGAYAKQYNLNTFQSGGWSAIKLIPEPSTGDALTQKIYIQNIQVNHPPGILISTPAPMASLEVKVGVRTDVSTGLDSIREIILQNPLAEPSTGFLTNKKMVETETRHSFLLRPRMKVQFPIHLPRSPVLKFSFTADGPPCEESESPELIIRSQPAWGFHKTLLRKRLNTFEKWIEQEISLEKYSNDRTILTFEARSSKSAECRPNVWIANPIVSSREPRRKPKTIIIFSADALRADHLGIYGYSRDTSPTLDQFSRESVLFRNAISQAPWTLPSFASLLTSLYPSFHDAYFRYSKLDSTYTLLPEILKKKNFLTAGYIKNGFLNQHRGLDQGFDQFHAAKGNSKPDERLNQILTWLEDNRDQDLFLLMHFLEPHSPYEAPEQYMHKFVGSKRRVLDTSTENLVRMNDSGIQISPEERNYLIALYDAEIAHLDSIFARFRQKLEQLDLYDSALIVFLSDHGEEFQDHGMLMHTARLYQELVHVPLVIKFPVESGIGSKSIAAPVALVDVMPTILSYFNIPAGTPLHGRNLLPMIQSKEDSARTIMTERNDVRMLALLDGSHKYIYNGKTGEEEIYDLKNDPHEEQNLIRSRQDLLDTFRKQRQDFVRRVEHYKKNKQSGGQTVVLSEEDEQNLLALGYVQ